MSGDGRGAPKLLDRLPETILTLGDLAYWKGSAKQFRRCYDPTWGRHKHRTWPAPGNHEYRSDRGADDGGTGGHLLPELPASTEPALGTNM